MKIDEAISLLKQYIDYNNPDIPDFYTMEEACEVVIKALEQQPTDAVDRVTIKEYLDSFGKETNVTATSELSSIRHELSPSYNGVKTELEPCGDCISREAVMHILDEVGGDFDSPREAVVPIDYIADMVSELPSVTPQPKMGRWERDKFTNQPTCSVCGYKVFGGQTRYCPNCGVKMQEVEE